MAGSLSPTTLELLDTAFASQASAQQANATLQTQQDAVTAAQATLATDQTAATQATTQATTDAQAALAAVAADLGLPFPPPGGSTNQARPATRQPVPPQRR